MDNIVVYCGSNYGLTRDYYVAAKEVGQLIAERGSRLVYGGGKVGLMGAVADAALAAGGDVCGVIPTFLREKELAHTGVQELIETPDMATRKSKMIELGDAFIALAGGIGTFEELFEVLSLAQLQQIRRPVGLLNTLGFYDPLLALLQQTIQYGFMPAENMSLLCVSDNPRDLLQQMTTHQAIDGKKWQRPAWLDSEGL
ncbi:MAG: TIGR00730 family Rossman fold protein [Neisseria sp.]|nr:TIGR00730 family Rossman fold protein [Neisseria sp.]